MDASADIHAHVNAGATIHAGEPPLNSLAQPTLHYVDGVRAVCALFVLVAHYAVSVGSV